MHVPPPAPAGPAQEPHQERPRPRNDGPRRDNLCGRLKATNTAKAATGPIPQRGSGCRSKSSTKAHKCAAVGERILSLVAVMVAPPCRQCI